MSALPDLVLMLVNFDKAISWPSTQRVVNEALAFFRTQFDIDRVSITLFQSQSSRLTIYTQDTSIPELSNNLSYSLEPTEQRRNLAQTKPRYSSSLLRLKHLTTRQNILLSAGILSSFHIPLHVGGVSFGSLNLGARQVAGIDKTTRDLVTLLSSRLALALYHARLHDTLKTKERELVSSEQNYRELIDQAGDAIIKGDSTGAIIQANKAAIRMFGYSQDELLSMNISALFSNKVLKQKPLRYDLLREGHTVISERSLRRKDRSSLAVEMNSKKLSDGSFVSIIRDLTERKKTHQKLSDRESQLRAVFDAVPAPLYAKDRKGKYIFLNDAYLKFFGRTAEEMIGKTVHQCWPEETASRFEKADQLLLKENKKRSYSTILKNARQEIRHVHIHKARYFDSEGNVAGFIGTLWDYTKLKAAEERYHNLFTYSPDPIVVHNGKKVLTANHAALKFFKTDNPEKYFNRPLFELIHPDSLQESRERIKQLFATGLPNELSTQRFIIANKDIRDVEVMSVPIDYDGQRAVMTSFRDITEQKHHRDQLLASEENFRNLFEANPNPVIVHVKGSIVYANHAAIKFGGQKNLKAVLGKDAFSFVHKDFRKQAKENSRLILKTGKASDPGEQVYLGKGGLPRFVESRGIPIVYENKNAIMVAFRDITEEKTTREALLKSKERYQRSFDFSPTPMLLHDKGVLVDANQAAMTFAGIKRLEDFVGKELFQFIHSDYIEGAMKVLKTILETDRAGPVRRQRFITLSGEERWVEASSVPVHQGNKLLVLLSFNDIHDQVIARELIEKSRRQLEVVTDHVTHIIVLLDLNLNLLFANQACANWFGLDKQALIGKNLADLFIPAAYNATLENLQFALKGKPNQFHYTFNSRRHGTLEFWTTLVPVFDSSEKIISVLAQTEDITDRETTRRELADNQELLKLIVDTIPGLFSYTSIDQKYLYVNQAYADWHHREQSEIIGKTLKQVLPAETYRHITPYLSGIKKGEEQFYSRWFTNSRGAKRALDIHYIPHFDQDHNVKAFLTSIQDVTRQKEAEAHQTALRELAHSLTKSMDLHSVGRVSAQTIQKAFNSDALSIELYNYNTKIVEGIYSEDTFVGKLKPQEVKTHDLPFATMNSKWFSDRLRATCINRPPGKESQAAGTIRFGDNRLSNSLLFVPLRWEGEIIGLVSVQSYTYNQYSTEDLPLLQSYVDQIGGALVRAQRDAQLLEQRKVLEQEEKKYRSIIENAGDAVLVTTLTGNIKTVNEQACTSLGYSQKELSNMNIRDIDPRFFKLLSRKQLAELKQKDNSLTLQSTYFRKDQTSLPVELRISLNEINKRRYLLCFVRDITDRKLAELREQALRKLAHDLNESTDMHTVGQLSAKAIRSFFDSDAFAIEYFDTREKQILGVYSEDTFRGKGEPREVMAVSTPFSSVRDDFFRLNSVVHVRNRTPEQIKNLKSSRPFGSSRFSHSLLFAPISWGGKNVGVLTVQSYTDNKYTEKDLPNIQTFANQIGGALIRTRKDEELLRQQKALIEGEEKYRSMIENAGDALFVTSLKGKILAFNRHATQSLGYDEEELLGLNLTAVNPMFKTVLPRKQLKDLVKTHASTTVETSHLRKDGSEIPVELRVGTMELQGKPCILYFARDISERKGYEVFYAALRKMARELTTSLRPRDVGQIASSVLYNLFDHDAFVLYKIDLNKNQGVNLYAEDTFSGDLRPREIKISLKPFDFSDFNNVMILPKPLLVNRTKKGEALKLVAFGNTRRRSSSLVFVPIFWEGHQIGLFTLQSYTKNKFNEEATEKLKIFANQIGGALIRAQTDLELTIQTNMLLEREQELEAAVEEKEVLLKEVYHRTKNNMQVMIGLLEMHGYKTKHDQTRVVLGEMVNRITSMSMVHDLLYRSKSLAEIKLDIYLEKLVSRLIAAYQTSSGDIQLTFEAEPIPINIQLAVPLGLVINEIVSNALKYAFPDNKDGQIYFQARSWQNEGLDLIISDNGIGLEHVTDSDHSTSMGTRIIRDIVELQLFGEITTSSVGGVEYHIRIPRLSLG